MGWPGSPRRTLAGGAVLLALAAALPAGLDIYAVEFATGLFLWIALAESWLLLSGYAGYVSLGHAAFVGAGAYTFVLTWGLVPFWLGMVLAGSTGAVLAAVIGTPCLRVRGPYFVILTLGVSEFLKFAVINVEAGLGSFGRLLMGQPSASTLFYVALGLAAAAFALAHAVRGSRLGAGLRAIRENETAAEMTGVRVGPLKSLAFLLSAIVPGMVGALMVARTGYFEPAQIFSPQISLTIIAICVAGGSDSPWGPVLGSLVLVVAGEVLRDAAPELYLIVLGAVLVLFVLNMPEGLHGWLLRRFGRRSVGTGTFGDARLVSVDAPTSASPQPLPQQQPVHAMTTPAIVSLIAPPPSSPILVVESARKTYGGLVAVADVSFSVGEGERVGLMGANGAGKTTMFNLVSGAVHPSGGTVRFLGERIDGWTADRICRAGIGRTYQIVKPFGGMSVLENVMVGLMYGSMRDPVQGTSAVLAEELLAEVGLLAQRDKLARELTLAGRKRLEIARALATRPRLLMLDEVLAGLTPTESEDALQMLLRLHGQRPMAMLIVEHNLRAMMRLCERIVVLHHGEKIAEGPPAQIVQDRRVIDAYLGTSK